MKGISAPSAKKFFTSAAPAIANPRRSHRHCGPVGRRARPRLSCDEATPDGMDRRARERTMDDAADALQDSRRPAAPVGEPGSGVTFLLNQPADRRQR